MIGRSRTAPDAPVLMRCTTTIAGFLEDAVYEVVGGPLPRDIARFFEPYTGTRPDRVTLIDAAAAAATCAAEDRRRDQPATPVRYRTAAEVRDVFGWSEEMFTRARESHGFPKPRGMREHRVQRGGQVRLDQVWTVEDIETWRAALAELVRGTKL